jgi:enamine deaminase RidA (YjgF/YER057c/UK114 family)
MNKVKNRPRIPRRKLLSDSAKLVTASAAAALLSGESATAGEPQPSGNSQRKKKGRSHLKYLNPPTIAAPRGYTHIVEVSGGRTIYISGQVALDQAGRVVGAGNLRAQAQQVFENIKAALEAAGTSFANVVKLNYYLLDASQVQVVRDVRDKYVDVENPPASTLVEVRKLARDEYLIEVEVIASVL